jgi:hypothetical protein
MLNIILLFLNAITFDYLKIKINLLRPILNNMLILGQLF